MYSSILTKPDLCRYEVNFQDGIDCGGAYIKLLSDSKDLDLVSTTTDRELHLKITKKNNFVWSNTTHFLYLYFEKHTLYSIRIFNTKGCE